MLSILDDPFNNILTQARPQQQNIVNLDFKFNENACPFFDLNLKSTVYLFCVCHPQDQKYGIGTVFIGNLIIF